MIPEEFKCAGFTVKVVNEDYLPNNEYGYYDDARSLIKLARYIKTDDEDVKLSEEQRFNTFAHELIHVFQFYFNNTFDEAQAQTFANFYCEFIRTSK